MTTPRRTARRIKRDKQIGAGYSRFSTVLQGSIPEQEGLNEELALDHSITLVAQFSDEAISRDIADRTGLLDLFAFIETHPEVGFIVVNELERITGDLFQRAEIDRFTQRLDITLVTEEPIGLIGPYDEDKKQQADELAVKAKGELRKGRRRTRGKMRQKVINGTVMMRPAFGTRMKPLIGPDGEELPSGSKIIGPNGKVLRSGVLEEHPNEIEWLRKMFEWADGGASHEEIARKLTDAGVPTKSGQPVWRQNSVAGILSNPLYKGDMIWGKQAVVRDATNKKILELRDEDDPGRIVKKSPLGALVDPALWDRVAARRAAAIGTRSGSKRKHDPPVLDGLVRCAQCGQKMYPRVDNPRQVAARGWAKKWRYACNGTRLGAKPKPGFDGHAAGEKILHIAEAKVLAALATLGTTDQQVTVFIAPANTDDDLAARRIDKSIAELKLKRTRIAQNFEDGDYTHEEKKAKQAEVDADIAKLNAEKAELAAPPATIAPRLSVKSTAWARLVELLADESIPTAHRAQGLRDAGVELIYVGREGVAIQPIRGNAGSKSSLLRLENRDSAVHAL